MAMDGVSMYRQDYPGHPTEPVQLARRKDARTVPLVKFEANPTYTSKNMDIASENNNH